MSFPYVGSFVWLLQILCKKSEMGGRQGARGSALDLLLMYLLCDLIT